MSPAALLTRRDGALVALEPVLSCATGEGCDTCDVADDCRMFGDPSELLEAAPAEEAYERRETARYPVYPKPGSKDELREWELEADLRLERIAENMEAEG